MYVNMENKYNNKYFLNPNSVDDRGLVGYSLVTEYCKHKLLYFFIGNVILLQKGVYKNHACGDNNMGPLQGLCTPDTGFPIGGKTTVTVEN